MSTVRLLAPTLALAAALVSGCAGGSDDAASTSDRPVTQSAMPTIGPDAGARAPHLTGARNAVTDLVVRGCGSGQGDVEATGTVHNGTARRVDYVVTVAWVTSTGGVVARDVTTVRGVAPGHRAGWTVHATLTDSASYSCTTSVERGRL